jgi:S1-C subfamily serine protease
MSVLGCLVAGLGGGLPAAAEEGTDLGNEIEAARAELDAAARKLAELHRRAGDQVAFVASAGMPMPGPARARLGVLLGGRNGAGIVVAGVTPGGGAEAAGLATGDVLLVVDEVPINGSVPALLDVLDDLEPGTVAKVEYERAGRRRQADVRLEAGGAAFTAAWPAAPGHPPHFAFGRAVLALPFELRDLDAQLATYFGVERGVLVVRGGPGAGALESGDVIRTIAGTAPADAHDALRRLHEAAGPLTVRVLRHGAEREVNVDLSARATTFEMTVPPPPAAGL